MAPLSTAPPPASCPPSANSIGPRPPNGSPPLPPTLATAGIALSQWHALVNDADDAARFLWGPVTIPCFLCFAYPACTEEQRHLQVRYQVAHDAGGAMGLATTEGVDTDIHHTIVFFRDIRSSGRRRS